MMENTFGERIKELRLKANTTQKELAEKLEISPASIIAYEKGQKSPSIDVAVKIANYFEASLDKLCGIKQASGKFKSQGDIVKALYNVLVVGKFNVNIRKVRSGGGMHGISEEIEIATIHPTGCWAHNDIYLKPFINEFLVKFKKMYDLLNDRTISYDIFETWLTSEISSLDKNSIIKDEEADADAETEE